MLNKVFLSHSDVVREQLKSPVLVVPNALDVREAEALYQALDSATSWSKQDIRTWQEQGYDLADFEYKRKHIDLESDFAPPELKGLNQYMNKPETRQWFTNVCGRSCDRFIASATLFGCGDHISEHNDEYTYEELGKPRYTRALTFNYYLSKMWESDWGGNLIWKDPYQCIVPSFNTLVLFRVTENSNHWVEPVKENALEKRLSITGWFLTEIRSGAFNLSLGK